MGFSEVWYRVEKLKSMNGVEKMKKKCGGGGKFGLVFGVLGFWVLMF